jgi:hypothetical protein
MIYFGLEGNRLERPDDSLADAGPDSKRGARLGAP